MPEPASTEMKSGPEVVKPPFAMPEVRQCIDPKSHLYGSVAVKSILPHLAWGVFNPTSGGHWLEDDAIVQDWPVASFPQPTNTQAPEPETK